MERQATPDYDESQIRESSSPAFMVQALAPKIKRLLDNVNGVLVWQNPTLGNLIDTSWQTFEYALPMADNNPSVQVEFRLITDAGLQLGGWNIDDFELGTRTAPALPRTKKTSSAWSSWCRTISNSKCCLASARIYCGRSSRISIRPKPCRSKKPSPMPPRKSPISLDAT